MHPSPHPELLADIARAAGLQLDAARCAAVSGGDISAAFRCTDKQGRHWFLKLNRNAFAAAFAAELAGLQELQQAELRTPQAVAYGVSGSSAWLLLEWLDMSAGNAGSAALLGEQLAAMHRITAAEHGWRRDNYIGSSPQLNSRHADWARFYAVQRLQAQLDLAAANSAPAALVRKGQDIVERLPELLAGYQPEASLLHGDLWAGNWARLPGGDPVVFDPAVYYGDRETDLAMTRLFGGFPAEFYRAYAAAWPLADGHEFRQTLYQLYHVINHFNIFGGAYAAQAERMLRTLLDN